MTEPAEPTTSRWRLLARLRAVGAPRGEKDDQGHVAQDPRARLFGLLPREGKRAERDREGEERRRDQIPGAPRRSPNPNRPRRVRVDAAFSSPSHLEREWLDLFREVEEADSYPGA